MGRGGGGALSTNNQQVLRTIQTIFVEIFSENKILNFYLKSKYLILARLNSSYMYFHKNDILKQVIIQQDIRYTNFS